MSAVPCTGWQLDHWEIRNINYEWQPAGNDDQLTVYMNWWGVDILHIPFGNEVHYVKAVFSPGCNPDLTPPVISLLGAAEVEVECEEEYIDAGATATDNCDGDLTSRIVVTGNTFNTDSTGTYVIRYNVRDGAGNVATEVMRIVRVVDTEPPVITLTKVGDDVKVVVECGTSYRDPGATATDACDGGLYVHIDATGVDTNEPGDYAVKYTATDGAGNKAETTRPVEVKDTKKPKITLIGSGVVTVECKGAYTEYGATASDDCYDDLTDDIVIDASSVDTDVPGTYTVTYDVSDGSGNVADTVTRTVIVEDTEPPVITLRGEEAMTIECGDEFADPGATAFDDCDGDVTNCSGSGTVVDTSCTGSHTITYNASDSAGNEATEVTRTVTVVDTTPPVINLNGDNPATAECKGSYVDAGATATDKCEGDLTGNISTSSTVNTAEIGTYYVTYTVSDSSGNTAEVKRTVEVKDTLPPTLTLIGDAEVTIECMHEYIDGSANAYDICNGALSNRVQTSGSIDVGTVGTYILTYSVTDDAGNTSEISRNFNIIDTEKPIITLKGEPEVIIPPEGVYIEKGARANDMCEKVLDEEVIVGGDTVDTSNPGTYIITYNVSDSSGNAADEVIRTVIVKSFWVGGILHGRINDPVPARNEDLLPVAPFESLPIGETFIFELFYIGDPEAPIRWELIDIESTLPHPLLYGEGTECVIVSTFYGHYYIKFYIDENENTLCDPGEDFYFTNNFKFIQYNTVAVNFTIHEDLVFNSMCDDILQRASLHLSKKEEMVSCGEFVDHRAAFNITHNGAIGTFGPNFQEMHTFQQLVDLRGITTDYTFRIVDGFWFDYNNDGILEDNRPERSTKIHGLTSRGDLGLGINTSILDIHKADDNNEYSLWIHEYVHQFQNDTPPLPNRFNHNNMCSQYIMHESFGGPDNYGIYSNTRDLLEKLRRP